MKKSCLILTTFLMFISLSAQAEEVRTISLRNKRVEKDGTIKLFTAFLSGNDTGITKLDPAKLRIQLDGEFLKEQGRIVPFVASGERMAVLLAVDISGTMSRALPKIRGALIHFINQMRNGDWIAIGTIGNSWKLVQDFTGKREVAKHTLKKLKANARTTALFESIVKGIDMTRKQGTHVPARRYMIVVSDGYNEKRGYSVADCIDNSKRHLTQVYSLIFLARRSNKFLVAKGDLEKISTESGAKHYTTSKRDKIWDGVVNLRKDLIGEVVVTLPGSMLNNDGKDHTLTLRYDNAKATLRYQAPFVQAPPKKEPKNTDPTSKKEHKNETKKEDDKEGKGENKKEGKKFPWLIVGSVVIILLIIIFAVAIIFIRNKRKAEDAAAMRDEAHRKALEQQESEMERLEQEKEELARQKAEAEEAALSLPQEPPQPAIPSGGPPFPEASKSKRKTEYRPPAAGGLSVTRFRVLHGLEGIPHLDLPPEGARIGYDLSNRIVLNVDSVSAFHAELVPVAGGMAIKDLGSTNGTFVDGVRIGAQPVPLKPGSQVKLGLVVLMCE